MKSPLTRKNLAERLKRIPLFIVIETPPQIRGTEDSELVNGHGYAFPDVSDEIMRWDFIS